MPAPASLIKLHPVSTEVNNVRTKGAELADPIDAADPKAADRDIEHTATAELAPACRQPWLRWGARLEHEWTEQWFPWIAGAVLFFLSSRWLSPRSQRSTSAPTWRLTRKAAWLIAHGHAPDLTVTGINLLAQHCRVGMYPIGWVTHVLPTIPDAARAASGRPRFRGRARCGGSDGGWRSPRRGRADLGLRLLRVYPAINNLNLDGLPPEAAVAPGLPCAFDFAETAAWRWCCLLPRGAWSRCLSSAELGW